VCALDTTSVPSEARRSTRWRLAVYWVATLCVCAELVLGGVWDVTRIPDVRTLVEHLGYPSYFLVLLGVWKLLGAVALLVPKRPLLKEWAYAGIAIDLGSAIIAHLAVGDGAQAWGWAAGTGVLWGLSYFLWRRLPRREKVAAPTR